MAKAVRRIVTGHRPDGRSSVLSDGPTEETPASLSGNADCAARSKARSTFCSMTAKCASAAATW